jgi:hypothetical protein
VAGGPTPWTPGSKALATLVYGPLPMDGYRASRGTKVAVLLLFAALGGLESRRRE